MWGGAITMHIRIGLAIVLATITHVPLTVGAQPAPTAAQNRAAAEEASQAGNFAEAARLYTLACDAGDAAACDQLAGRYNNGQGVPRDLARAVPLYQRACDGGIDGACLRLGVMYEMGYGVAPDPARAAQIYRTLCDKGVATGCSNLRTMKP
jgi:TPR repeat protein